MTPIRHRREWADRDSDYLRWHWGDKSPKRLAEELGRTVTAILCKARKLKLAPPSRGTVSLAALAKQTGYEERQIYNVARKLRINIRRVKSTYRPNGKHKPGGGWTALTDGQIEKILAFLKTKPDVARVRQETQGKWGERGRGGFVKPPCCDVCGRNDRPHYSNGLCKPCYDRRRPHRSKKKGDADGERRVDAGLGGERAELGRAP